MPPPNNCHGTISTSEMMEDNVNIDETEAASDDELNDTTVDPAFGTQGEIITDDVAEAFQTEALIVDNGVARTLTDAEATVINGLVYDEDDLMDPFTTVPAFDVLADGPVDNTARTHSDAYHNFMRVVGDDPELFDALGSDWVEDLSHDGIFDPESIPLGFDLANSLRALALYHYPPHPLGLPANIHGGDWPIHDDETQRNVDNDNSIIGAKAARALLTWTMRHLEPLALTNPSQPIDQSCPICHGPFILNDPQHTPILMKDIEGCVGHVFCNTCIINWLTSGQENANTCPLCRSELMKQDDDGYLLLSLDNEVQVDVPEAEATTSGSTDFRATPEEVVAERSGTRHIITQAESGAQQPSKPLPFFLNECTRNRMHSSLWIMAVVVLGIAFLRRLLDECILGWDEYKRFGLGVWMGTLVGAVTAIWLDRRRGR